jgi:hypothetical protein
MIIVVDGSTIVQKMEIVIPEQESFSKITLLLHLLLPQGKFTK